MCFEVVFLDLFRLFSSPNFVLCFRSLLPHCRQKHFWRISISRSSNILFKINWKMNLLAKQNKNPSLIIKVFYEESSLWRMLLLNKQINLHIYHSRTHSIFLCLFLLWSAMISMSSWVIWYAFEISQQICVTRAPCRERNGLCIGPTVEKTEDMPLARGNNGILGSGAEPQCCWLGAVSSLSKGVGISCHW